MVEYACMAELIAAAPILVVAILVMGLLARLDGRQRNMIEVTPRRPSWGRHR